MNIQSASISEIFLSMVSIWWAIVLLVNQNLFDEAPQVYEGIADVTDEKIWAGIFMFGAVVKVVGIIMDNGFLRKLGLTLSSLFYAIICAGYLWSGAYLFAGTGIYFSMTMLALWRLREVRLLYAGRPSSAEGESKIPG